MLLLRNDRGTALIVNTSEAPCARFEFGIILGALIESICVTELTHHTTQSRSNLALLHFTFHIYTINH